MSFCLGGIQANTSKHTHLAIWRRCPFAWGAFRRTYKRRASKRTPVPRRRPLGWGEIKPTYQRTPIWPSGGHIQGHISRRCPVAWGGGEFRRTYKRILCIFKTFTVYSVETLTTWRESSAREARGGSSIHIYIYMDTRTGLDV